MLCRLLQMIIHVWMSSAAHHLKQTLDKKACQHHGHKSGQWLVIIMEAFQ